MTIKIKSSEVRQKFGRIIDQALIDDVIVERHGKPSMVIVSYHRYQKLLEAEQAQSGPYLVEPNRTPEARQRGQLLAEQVRQELASLSGSLDEEMASLRGRS